MQENNSRQVVLVVRFYELGDVAMTIPSLYDACMANPDATVVMLTRASIAGLFVNGPSNLVVEGVNRDDYKGVGGMWRLMSDMVRKHGVTTVVDLQNSAATKLLCLAARMHRLKTVSIDKGYPDKKRLTRRVGKVMLPLTHSIDRYRMTFEAAGLSAGHRFTGLFDGCEVAPKVYSTITRPKQRGEVWIGIAPFAKHECKIYPLNLMEHVLRELSGRSDTTVFLFGGGPYEQKILGEWARKYPSTYSLAGQKHGFGVELALFHDLDAMITMDSANMHMAALAGAPVIAVWGATHPYCGYGGWGVDDDNNIQLPIPCRPCSVHGDKPCLTGDLRCLSGIRPSLITDRVDALLGCRGDNS